MHHFDRNGWIYGESRVETLAQQIRSQISEAVLITNLGGKAFGLSLAKVLGGDVFTIPMWRAGTLSQPLPEKNELEQVFCTSGLFVRSNAADEDWSDSRSGLHESRWASFTHSYQSTVDQLLGACGGVVVQDMVWGVGVVIDLAWSELLQRNVLRVAIGCPSNQGGRTVYTSPTWDNEAQIGLFDAETGEVISELETSYVDVRRIVDKMTKHIVPRLVRLGINFGLQFEFVAELNETRDSLARRMADRVPRDALVQVRPSPSAIQGHIELPARQGELLVTTGKVNQQGHACAEVVFVEGHNRQGPVDLSRLLHIAGDQGTRFDILDPARPLVKDKIVLWDHHGGLNRYECVSQILGAWRLGALAQLSGRSLFTNSAHGTSSPYLRNSRMMTAFEEARGVGPLLSIGTELEQVLRRLIRKAPLTLQIISDGLVGQVYRI